MFILADQPKCHCHDFLLPHLCVSSLNPKSMANSKSIYKVSTFIVAHIFHYPFSPSSDISQCDYSCNVYLNLLSGRRWIRFSTIYLLSLCSSMAMTIQWVKIKVGISTAPAHFFFTLWNSISAAASTQIICMMFYELVRQRQSDWEVDRCSGSALPVSHRLESICPIID